MIGRDFEVNSLPVGKLPSALLRRFIDKIQIEDEQVVLGPSIGEDVAVIRLGNKLLVAKTDPVTFATDFLGWYAVHVNANDIATMGVKPRWFLATILLPEHSTQKEAEGIFDQILSACNSFSVQFSRDNPGGGTHRDNLRFQTSCRCRLHAGRS